MAQIPTVNGYDRVQLAPLRPTYEQDVSGSYPRVSPNAHTTAAIGAGISDVGDIATKDYLQWQTQDNERAAKDLDTQYSDAIRKLQFGDGTEQNQGYFGNVGQNALTAYQPTVDSLKQTREQILNNISNPAVKRMFDQTSAVRASSAEGQFTEYSVKQRTTANLTSSQSRANAAIEDAVANPQNVPLSLRVMNAESSYQSKLNGEDIDTAKLHAAQNRGSVIGAAVENLAISDPEGAVKLFEANKRNIDPISTIKLRKTLDDATVLSRAQSNADAIVSKGLGLEASMDLVRQIPDAKVREEAHQQVMQRFNETWTAQQHAWSLQEHADGQDTKAALGDSQKAVDNTIAAFDVKDDATGKHDFDLVGALDSVKDQDYSPKVRALVESGIKAYAEVQNGAETREETQKVATENEITRQYNIQKHQQEQAVTQATSSAAQWVHSGKALLQWQQQNPDQNNLLEGQLNTLDNLRKDEVSIAKGQLYSQISDGSTLTKLKSLPADQLATVDPLVYRGRLTETEFNSLSTAISGASTRVDAVQNHAAQYYNQGEQFLKTYAPKNMRWDSNKQSQNQKDLQQQAINEMSIFVNTYTSQGKVPPAEDLKGKAQQIMLSSGGPQSSLNSLAIGRTIGTVAGQIAYELTPTQKAAATIPYDQIPDDIIQQIKEAIRINKKDENDVGLIENLAGAQATGDKARARKLLLGN